MDVHNTVDHIRALDKEVSGNLVTMFVTEIWGVVDCLDERRKMQQFHI